eukprot:4365764-Amphidinium_carterae.1
MTTQWLSRKLSRANLSAKVTFGPSLNGFNENDSNNMFTCTRKVELWSRRKQTWQLGCAWPSSP